MPDGLRTIIYPVKDLAKAKAFYGALLGDGGLRVWQTVE
jgi:extradiol dioxygenase family protein